MRHIKLLFTIVFTALCVTLFLSGCDGGSNDTNINSDISRFSGTYSGTFTGDDIGSFTFNVDNRGGITGSGISNAVGSFINPQ
jgi:hypothetical protein